MTSFCRRVIAMRMIVANKKRIASLYIEIGHWLLTDLVPGSEFSSASPWGTGLLVAHRQKKKLYTLARDSRFEIECARFCKEFL
jgi:hypothetical protein